MVVETKARITIYDCSEIYFSHRGSRSDPDLDDSFEPKSDLLKNLKTQFNFLRVFLQTPCSKSHVKAHNLQEKSDIREVLAEM